jgi:hypothetical protein
MDIADCGTNAKPGALRKTAFVCAVTALFCLPALSFGLMAGIVYFGEDFFEGRSPRWFDGVLWALMLSLVASILGLLTMGLIALVRRFRGRRSTSSLA